MDKVDQSHRGLRFLVTGANGFIGSHLCRRLCEGGCEVHATSRAQRANMGGPIWWQADMSDLSAVRSLLKSIRPDVIFHLAGSVGASPTIDLILPTFHSLLASTINVLVAASENDTKRVIISGSSTEPSRAEIHPVPGSPYAAAKWAASGYGRLFAKHFEAPVVILKPFMVYGPSQALTKLIPSVTMALLSHQRPRVSSGGFHADWIYIDDIVDGFVAGALVPGIEGETIDLGTGKLSSIRDIVDQLVSIVGNGVVPVFGAVPDRPGEEVTAATTEMASNRLRWSATIPLNEGLKRTVAWYRLNYGPTLQAPFDAISAKSPCS
jgi:UDP-glucose 4-epimerase